MKIYIFITFLTFFSATYHSDAKVYMTKEKALNMVFPDADRIDKQRVFLSATMKKDIENRSKTKLESNIYIFYVGIKNDSPIGYSILSTHTVRTKTETVLITINPDATIKQIDILAFFEPTEYMSTERWLNIFPHKSLLRSLRIGRDIPNISGATLTSNAIVDSIRKSLALFEITCTNVVCKGV